MYSNEDIEIAKEYLTFTTLTKQRATEAYIDANDINMQAKLELLTLLIENEKEQLGILSLSLSASYRCFVDDYCNNIEDSTLQDARLNLLETIQKAASDHFNNLFDYELVTHMTDMEAVAVHIINCDTAAKMFGDSHDKFNEQYNEARNCFINTILNKTGFDLSDL